MTSENNKTVIKFYHLSFVDDLVNEFSPIFVIIVKIEENSNKASLIPTKI